MSETRPTRFEGVLACLSSSLVAARAGSLEEALRQVGEYFGVDRCSLADLQPDQEARLTGSWSRAGVPGLEPQAMSALADGLADRLRSGRSVAIESVAALPQPARERAAAAGIHACLMMPVRVEGEVVAALSLGLVAEERRWNETVHARLQLIAELLAGVLVRRRAEREVDRLTARLEAENVYLRDELAGPADFREIIGESPALRAPLEKVAQVAATDATVLLLGETGTGKELFARAIHERSPRTRQALVKLNCAAIPSSLVESELFGHVKGAFTGATTSKTGRFELADGGTMFLDEIGDMDVDLQSKLLRVLQEGEFEPVGSSETRQVDVRVIAATNRDLHEAMGNGTFRPDLYYRLNVFPIEIPPLRHRGDDVLLLARRFIERGNSRLGRAVTRMPSAAQAALVAHDWPGNVRELENVIDRALILSSGDALALDAASLTTAPTGASRARAPRTDLQTLAEVERAHLAAVLEACHWTINGPGNAAEQLGLHPSTLRHRLKKHGLTRED